jgi:hypothetical protein
MQSARVPASGAFRREVFARGMAGHVHEMIDVGNDSDAEP